MAEGCTENRQPTADRLTQQARHAVSGVLDRAPFDDALARRLGQIQRFIQFGARPEAPRRRSPLRCGIPISGRGQNPPATAPYVVHLWGAPDSMSYEGRKALVL